MYLTEEFEYGRQEHREGGSDHLGARKWTEFKKELIFLLSEPLLVHYAQQTALTYLYDAEHDFNPVSELRSCN